METTTKDFRGYIIALNEILEKIKSFPALRAGVSTQTDLTVRDLCRFSENIMQNIRGIEVSLKGMNLSEELHEEICFKIFEVHGRIRNFNSCALHMVPAHDLIHHFSASGVFICDIISGCCRIEGIDRAMVDRLLEKN